MNFGLSFTNPWALLLWLPLAAYFVWLSRHSLTDLSPLRQRLALGIRLILTALIVLALAGAQFVRYNRDLAVMFVLDYSESIGPDAKARAGMFVEAAIKKIKPTDRWGAVVFGRDAFVEHAVGNDPTLGKIQSVPPSEFTDISAAIRLAVASLPDGMQKRVVVLSDGNENLGDALSEAQMARNNEVAIDIVPLSSPQTQEALIEKLTLPSEAKIGEPLEIRAVVSSTHDNDGTIKLFRDGKYLGSKKVSMTKGKNVFVFPQSVEQAGSATFEAQLEVPRGMDTVAENNRGLGFVTVRGKPRILLVSDDPAASRFLTGALAREKVDVEFRGSGGVPLNLRQMQPFDAIVLDNVAAWEMTPAQMLAIQSYVRDLGCGFVMIGGENAYGPGGYRSTPIEETLPVTMDIRNMQYLPGGAVAMIMHSLEFPDGNKWAKAICSEVTRQMSDEDYEGIVVYGFDATWVYPMWKVGPNRNQMLAKIRGINPGDMPDFDAALETAYQGLIKTPAYLKHIIILSDGDPSPPRPALVAKINKARITVSTIVINPHDRSGAQNMWRIAKAHGGRFYQVNNGKQIPKIFLKEAASVSRSAIIEGAFTPRFEGPSSILKGIDGLPKLLGYVGTSPKSAAQGARVVLSSNQGDPLLATRQYGLGKSVAWTSDARQRWSAGWLGWSGYSKFWAQTIRWSMRQSLGADLQTNVDIDKGKGRVTIEAVDEKGNFINFLNPKARLVPPSMKSSDIQLEQTGPGRYEATFDARELGTYLINVRTQRGDKTTSQVTGGVLPYSPEYSTVGVNSFLLSQIAEVSGGETITADKVFSRVRIPARAPKEVWLTLLIIATCLFPIDVAIRRLMWGEEQLEDASRGLRSRLNKRKTASVPPEPRDPGMERLLKNKRRATASSDTTSAPKMPTTGTKETGAPSNPANPVASQPGGDRDAAQPATEEETLDPMERLRRAKRRARGEE